MKLQKKASEYIKNKITNYKYDSCNNCLCSYLNLTNYNMPDYPFEIKLAIAPKYNGEMDIEDYDEWDYFWRNNNEDYVEDRTSDRDFPSDCVLSCIGLFLNLNKLKFTPRNIYLTREVLIKVGLINYDGGSFTCQISKENINFLLKNSDYKEKSIDIE